MAVAPSTNMLFVGTRKTTVWAVTDRNSDGVADEVKPFAPSPKFTCPTACAGPRTVSSMVVEHNRVLNFPAAEFFYEGRDVAVIEVVPQGQLIPAEEESTTTARAPAGSAPDGKLYITLGQPYNVQPRDKLALYNKLGIGGIVRMNAFDGTGARSMPGIRNSVGIDFNPKDKSLWFTDNQTDGMGDDTPPGEINRATDGGAAFRLPVHTATVSSRGRRRRPKACSCPPAPSNAAGWSSTRTRPSWAWPSTTARCSRRSTREASSSPQHGSWNRTKPDRRAHHVHSLKAGWLSRQEQRLRRGLAGRERHLPRPTGRRGDDEGRLAARQRRFRGRDLPHHLLAVSRVQSCHERGWPSRSPQRSRSRPPPRLLWPTPRRAEPKRRCAPRAMAPMGWP